jgi:hypothetical protein
VIVRHPALSSLVALLFVGLLTLLGLLVAIWFENRDSR